MTDVPVIVRAHAIKHVVAHRHQTDVTVAVPHVCMNALIVLVHALVLRKVSFQYQKHVMDAHHPVAQLVVITVQVVASVDVVSRVQDVPEPAITHASTVVREHARMVVFQIARVHAQIHLHETLRLHHALDVMHLASVIV